MRCGYRNRRVTSEDLADPKTLLRDATDVRTRVARVLDLLAERRAEAAEGVGVACVGVYHELAARKLRRDLRALPGEVSTEFVDTDGLRRSF